MRFTLRTIVVLAFIFLRPRFGLAQSPPPFLFPDNFRILFQGDSITDGGRGRTGKIDPNNLFGQDYAYLLTARYAAAYPALHLTFYNRGISGNEVSNLANRWQKDAIDLKPDVVSILIGVNDIGHALRQNQPVSIENYEKTYDALLAQSRAANPNVRFILCDPFRLSLKSTDANFDQEWAQPIAAMHAVVEKLAAKYHAPVVHFQKIFDDATRLAPASYWLWDGVHPSAAGHQLMADEWQRVYAAFYGTPATTQP